MRIVSTFLLLLPIICCAQYQYPSHDYVDALHYAFHLELNDTTNNIRGSALLTMRFTKPSADLTLDLVSKDAKGKGMTVTSVVLNEKKITYSHINDRLLITLPKTAAANDVLLIRVDYTGVARDGLIIGKNMFGDRGFFGDNWPNRAHHWLPCIDHPSDKASVDFTIVAPPHYSVVANGLREEESYLNTKQKLTRYHEAADIATKVMVMGAARFAVERAGEVGDVAVESWVYPQNRENGFGDYKYAVQVLDFFNSHIGPYAYRKLANVQSKTTYGGLENAGAIFYFEQSVNGRKDQEGLIAHEVAHQWFGDAATEQDWSHVWLSEGFSTYFKNVYLEFTHGEDRRVTEMKKERNEVIQFYRKTPLPIVFAAIPDDLMEVLNLNSYQKGGWVLHMLRREVGDEVFWKGIRLYYSRYKNSNAWTIDFQRVMEEVSGKDLAVFFKQWLYTPGHPVFDGSWAYDAAKKELVLTVRQTQTEPVFVVSLEIGIYEKEGQAPSVRAVRMDKKMQEFRIPLKDKPLQLGLDPNTHLLFDGKLKN